MEPASMLASGFMSGMSSFGQVAGAAMIPAPAVSSSDANRMEAVFDNSGWNVAFGGGDITSDRQQLPAIGLGNTNPTMMLVFLAAGLVALKIIMKARKNAG